MAMAKPMANKENIIYTEFVWRKEGEERCDWTPMQSPTEKKALREEPSANSKSELQDTPNFPQMNLEPLHTRGVKGDIRKGGEGGHPQRYLVGQAIQNPFMPNSNYANDLEVQMNFLTPTKG
jgi:hypothetical protein